MFFSRLARPAIGLLIVTHALEYKNKHVFAQNNMATPTNFKFPKRSELLQRLKSENWDVLIIGGGATGAGIAYEAISRGLKVAMIERNDFASGTSSKSTKLIHGGVRYLKRAVTHLDRSEFNLVTEALNERKLLLNTCPNLVTPVPILLPCSNPFDFAYKAAGLALYELISWDHSMIPTYASKDRIRELLPHLKLEGIFNGIIYYDGQFDDARLNLTVIKTAIIKGLVACNYVNAENLIGDEKEIKSVVLKDKITGETFECTARCIVNATGPYTDSIRKMVDADAVPICRPASGVHLSMSNYLTDQNVGLLIYEPNDRVLFMLPWEGTTLVGTSDNPTMLDEKPSAKKEEVISVLERLSKVLQNEEETSLKHVKSCWSGIRPLVVEPSTNKNDTASVSRNHVIESSKNVISVSGGKWTTFRRMGEDTVNLIISKLGIIPNKPEPFALYGCGELPDVITGKLVDEGVDASIAKHLVHRYGEAAWDVIGENKKPQRLHKDYPYTEEELKYICKNEYVCCLEDVIARRMRLSFIDAEATRDVLAKISDIVSTELGWSKRKAEAERINCEKFLQTEMGLNLISNKEQ